MVHYFSDDIYDNLIDKLAGTADLNVKGWTQRDDVIWALMDAGIFPARIQEVATAA